MYFWDAQDVCYNFVHIRWHMNLYKGRRIHYDSQELVAANFQCNLATGNKNTSRTSLMRYYHYPLPTALDLEFKQLSKTFYVQMEYTLDCETCRTCWFCQRLVKLKPNDLCVLHHLAG